MLKSLGVEVYSGEGDSDLLTAEVAAERNAFAIASTDNDFMFHSFHDAKIVDLTSVR